jgi:hypothetical protein
LGELVPSFRWTSSSRKSEKEFAYFFQGEPRFTGALHHRQAKEHAVIVTTLAILSDRRRKNPDLLVVANRGGAQTKHPRDIGDRQVFCHFGIYQEAARNAMESLAFSLKIPFDLKLT